MSPCEDFSPPFWSFSLRLGNWDLEREDGQAGKIQEESEWYLFKRCGQDGTILPGDLPLPPV